MILLCFLASLVLVMTVSHKYERMYSKEGLWVVYKN